jgi:hypothetical protein
MRFIGTFADSEERGEKKETTWMQVSPIFMHFVAQLAGSNPAGISEVSPMVLVSKVRKLCSPRLPDLNCLV